MDGFEGYINLNYDVVIHRVYIISQLLNTGIEIVLAAECNLAIP